MTRLSDYLTMAAGIFLTAFFIPLIDLAGFEISLNFICVFLLCSVAVLEGRRILYYPGIVLGVFGTWLTMLAVYMLSSMVLGPRQSLMLLVAQFIFLTAAVALGFKLSEWHERPNGGRLLLRFSALSMSSFFVFALLYAPFDAISNMIVRMLSFDPIGTVYYSRRVFAPGAFAAGQALMDLSSFQNRVAQHLFSHGLLLLTIALLAVNRIKKGLSFYFVQASALVMMSFAVVLLSGQAIGEIFITIAFATCVMFMFRISYSLILVFGLVLTAMVASMPFILSTDLWALWAERFTGGNIDTGRTQRWLHYLTDTMDLTLLGLQKSDTLDPHNMYIGALFEGGVFALIPAMIFAGAVLFRTFYGLGAGVRRFGLAYALMMSVGLQTVFVTLISGGWGYPAWSEWSKFSLFVVGVLIFPIRQLVWTRTAETLHHTPAQGS